MYWSRKHEAIVAKVSSIEGIKVVCMEDLHKESGEIFVNYMTRLIMEDVKKVTFDLPTGQSTVETTPAK